MRNINVAHKKHYNCIKNCPHRENIAILISHDSLENRAFDLVNDNCDQTILLFILALQLFCIFMRFSAISHVDVIS